MGATVPNLASCIQGAEGASMNGPLNRQPVHRRDIDSQLNSNEVCFIDLLYICTYTTSIYNLLTNLDLFK